MGNRLGRRSLLRGFMGGGLAAGLTALPQSVSGAHSPVNYDSGMHAVITGSGSALPDPQRGNASQAIVVDGRILQFDCGRRAMDNLMQAGINPLHVESLFFTHMHFDHIATYGYFVISSWIGGRQTPIKVFGPEGTEEMSRGAFEHMHKLNVSFVKGIVQAWPPDLKDRPSAELPATVKDVAPGIVVETDRYKVTARATPHIGSWRMKSLGYRVDCDHGSVAISGDTAPSQAMVELARDADLLIHECVVPDFGMTRGGKFSTRKGIRRLETDTDRPATGHTSPSELGRLAQQAGVKRVVATHLPPYTSVQAAVDFSSLYYGPRQDSGIWAEFVAAIKRHYDGPVVMAEDAMVLKVTG